MRDFQLITYKSIVLLDILKKTGKYPEKRGPPGAIGHPAGGD